MMIPTSGSASKPWYAIADDTVKTKNLSASGSKKEPYMVCAAQAHLVHNRGLRVTAHLLVQHLGCKTVKPIAETGQYEACNNRKASATSIEASFYEP
jgi:hypothetical protein